MEVIFLKSWGKKFENRTNNKGVRAKNVITPVKCGVKCSQVIGDARYECVYTFGHNFLIICPIFKLFFFKFSERLPPSVGGVGVHEGTVSYPIS